MIHRHKIITKLAAVSTSSDQLAQPPLTWL